MLVKQANMKRSYHTANVKECDAEIEPKSKVPKEILVIAQEINIVKALSCNDPIKRNRQIRKLRKWLQLRSCSSFSFTDEDFMRICKGIYFNMWMSDKPLVQEKLADEIAKLLDCFNNNAHYSIMFFSAFIRTMCNEWFGIDQWRMDKFLMLIRRELRQMFYILKASNWKKSLIKEFNDSMQDIIFTENVTVRGLVMHYFDIFFEELAKVANGNITADDVNEFVVPFVNYIGTQPDLKLVAQCRTRVLHHLLHQSALGREYSEKFNAWKAMGFPTSSIDDLEKNEEVRDEEASVNDDNASDKSHSVLDPRAGGIDVYMPELPFNADCVLMILKKLLRTREYNNKRRKSLKNLIHIFETYKSGKFPLGIKRMPREKQLKSMHELISEKAMELENVENDTFGITRKLKQLNKRKRRKLLKSINFENVDEDNYDNILEKKIAKVAPALSKPKLQKKKSQFSAMNVWKVEKLSPEEIAASTKTLTASTELKPKAKIETDTPTDGEAKPNSNNELWDEPLKEGEVEYFIPSRKAQTAKANADFVLNPLSNKKNAFKATFSTPIKSKLEKRVKNTVDVIPEKKNNSFNLQTPKARNGSSNNSRKRIKIALKNNTIQTPSEYIKQLRSSPNLPFDAAKKPGKGLLKPNSMPSPIDPFYKRKIGLQIFNDTL